jgi:uncharacterized protein YqjF (DUF2071 family)
MTLRIPRLASTVERRLLINYRVDPEVAQTLLPDGLRPQLVDGSAVAGICLIRLNHLRPNWFRPRIGWGAENAAHRIAVEWDDATGTHNGVYIPQRHSASRLAVLAGGRIFPGFHKLARFRGAETADRISVAFTAPGTDVEAEVLIRPELDSSLFADLATASAFFRSGAVGWSPARDGSLEGLRLDTDFWKVEAAEAVRVRSSFFDALPAGSAVLDCVLVMRDVPITWSVPAGESPRALAAA